MDYDPKDPNILNLIASAIENGADPEDFKDILDQALGTGMSKSDPEKDQMWQDEFGSKES